MPAYTITIKDEDERRKAAEAVRRAPLSYRITFEEPKRSNDQNSRMWAMLGDVSKQYEYYGSLRSPEAWKDIFTAALREVQTVPSLDGKGIVQIGLRTSKMSKDEMSDLFALMEAFCAEHGITLNEKA